MLSLLRRKHASQWAIITVTLGLLVFLALATFCVLRAETADDGVQVEVADETRLKELVTKYRGKVILVDFWATWCKPCMKQFAHTVALSQKHPADSFKAISVSLDDVDDSDLVLRFLQSQKATIDNLHSRHGASAESFEAFALGTGALPAYRIYNAEGEIVAQFASGDPKKKFTTEELDQIVADEIAKAEAH